MDNKIILLDEHTINQIAAGEVIEQPASVVKELVENSMDSGSDHISIYVKDGGLREIKVTDNGDGIREKDIERAFKRYGTSKLNTIEDLYRLNTMGFRGEALASIAAVSKVTLMSKTRENPIGYNYIVEGGNPVDMGQLALKDGTTIKVENLFYNAPVRQKFLKSQLRETRAIAEIVEKLILSRPDISFELYIDNRLVIKSRGNNNLRELASIIYSFQAGKSMIEIEGERDGIKVHGLIGGTGQYRATREYINFFINNRYIKSRNLSRCFEEAYRNRLPIGKFPLGIIHLELPSYLVEVNIHPRKLEVKIDKENEVCELIKELVVKELIKGDFLETETKDESLTYKRSLSAVKGIVHEEHQGMEQLVLGVDQELVGNPFYPVEILGTIKDTYIIVGIKDILYIFDQHAAHERINFEKAQKEFTQSGFKTQMLLQPVVVELGAQDYLKLLEHIHTLLDYGVLLESFGDDAFLIRGLPLGIGKDQASVSFLLNLIDRIDDGDVNRISEYMIEKASCVRSVKAGQRVGKDELKSLIYRLGECEYPFTCPHGRPTFLKFQQRDLEKMFLRSKR